MAITKKQFKSDRYKWLSEAMETDPSLQKLYNDLEVTWKAYKANTNTLDYLYSVHQSKNSKFLDPDLPWN